MDYINWNTVTVTNKSGTELFKGVRTLAETRQLMDSLKNHQRQLGRSRKATLRIGSKVTVRGNRSGDVWQGKVFKINRTRIVVTDSETGKRWNVPMSMIE
jgi:hypothetical protein